MHFFLSFSFLFFTAASAAYRSLEVPRLGAESELQLPTCTTATAAPDLSPSCSLYCSLRQGWILNPLSETKDLTQIFTDILSSSWATTVTQCVHVLFFFFFFFVFLGLHPLHMKAPRLGVELELQPPAYTTATATWEPSHVFNLHYSSWQLWILNPLSEARDWTCIFMDANRVH